MPSTIWAWRLGRALDIIHIPGAILLLPLGHFWLPDGLHNIIVGTVIALQVICLGCPLMVVSAWLRKRHCPDWTFPGGITSWVYRRFGRLAGATLTIVLAVVVLGVIRATAG